MEDHLKTLLEIIDKQADVSSLLNAGLSYTDIAKLLQTAEQHHLMYFDGQKTYLTEKGKRYGK